MLEELLCGNEYSTEVRALTWRLDPNEVLEPKVLEVDQEIAIAVLGRLPAQQSEGLLMTCPDRRIEQLIAEPDDSRDTVGRGDGRT